MTMSNTLQAACAAMLVLVSQAAAAAPNAAARAESPALSPEQLHHCAGNVLALRQESHELNQRNQQLSARRQQINERSARLRGIRAQQKGDDLKAGLSLHDQVQRNNAEATAFNAQMEQLKHDIAAVNSLRLEYDESCANHPYHRSDLDRLPEDERQAMRRGLADVHVPYIENHSTISAPR